MNNPLKHDPRVYCDICCLQPDNTLRWPEDNTTPPLAIVDGPTRFGQHAYMCDRHLQTAGYVSSKMNVPVNTRFFNVQ